MSAVADPTKQLEYSTEDGATKIFGFWIFIGAEVVLFATLFATYLVLHGQTAGGPTSKELFSIPEFMSETFFLLTSSFTCGLAVLSMRRRSKSGYFIWMAVTLLLGLGFLGFEIHEFYTYVMSGAGLTRSAFLSGFFILVGTHGCHVTLGVFWIISVMIQVAKRGFTPMTARKIFMTGLYWHFLDAVWIFIFTAVYLTGLVVN